MDKSALNLKIDSAIYNKLQETTSKKGQSKTYIVEQALLAYLGDSVDKTTSNVDGEADALKKQLESELAKVWETLEGLSCLLPANVDKPTFSVDREPESLSNNRGKGETAPVATAKTFTEGYNQNAENEQQKEIQPEPENNAATSQTYPTEWMSIDDTVSSLQSFGIDIKSKKPLSDRASKAFKEKPSKEGEFTFRGLVMERRKAGQSYEYKIVNGK